MRIRRFTVVLLLPLMLVMLNGRRSEAMLVRAGEDVFVSPEETLTEDLALFASTISVDGYVDADVIAFSRSLVITGVINHDLQAGAETIDLTGQVGDDFRVGARYVDVRGPVGDDAIAFCERFTLGSGGRVGGEARVWSSEAYFQGDVDGTLRIGCNRAEVHGHVGGDLAIEASSIKISGPVDGNAELKAAPITLLPGCVIAGGLTYSSPEEIEIQEGARVMGSIERLQVEVKAEKEESLQKFLSGMGAIWAVLKVTFFVGQIIVGLILLGLFRRQSVLMATTFSSHVWKALGIGIVFACCATIASLILPFTVIGLPLAIMLICFSLIVWYLASIVVGLAVGGLMVGAFKTRSTGRLIGGLILGLLILRALSFVPILGLLVQLFVVLAGIGAILISLRTSAGGIPAGGSG
jgi:cytoskeletal protein CcmA (bactofilin family)